MPNQVRQHETDQKVLSLIKKRKLIGLMGCFGGFLVQLVIGSLYQWGIVSIYFTSYYRYDDQSVTLQSNAISFPLMMFCMGLTMRLGLYLAQCTHPVIMLTVNQILSSLVVLISSYMQSMWLFLVFYGILFGLIVGLSFMVPLVQCNKYFPGHKMSVNGFILIGTGVGSVVFGLFSYNFLNPNRLPPSQGYYLGSEQLLQIAFKVPILTKWLSLCYLCIGLLGVGLMAPLCIQNRRKQNQQYEKQKQEEVERQKRIQEEKKRQILAEDQEKLKAQHHHQVHHHHDFLIQWSIDLPHPQHLHIAPQSDQNPQKNSAPSSEGMLTRQPKSLSEAFRSKICWIEVAILLLTSSGAFMLNSNYKTYVKLTISDDQFLTIIGVIGAVGNGCSRFFWNLFFSKTGYKTVLLTILALSILVYSTIRFTVHYKEIYLIEIFCINCCIGGLLVTTPTLTQVLYGQETGSNIYGFYWEVIAIGNFLGYVYVAYLSKTIGFDNVIYVCLGMVILAVPIVILTKFEGPWKNQTVALEYCVGIEMAKIKKQEQKQAEVKQQQKKEQTLLKNNQNAQKAQANHISTIRNDTQLKPLKMNIKKNKDQLSRNNQKLQQSQNQILTQKVQ